MSLAAALVYWIIVALWLAILGVVARAFLVNRRTFGTTRLLLTVVTIDTCRNIIENIYFGSYFGAQFGLLPQVLVGTLGNPVLLIMPKLMNILAAGVVLCLLLLRWLPLASRERHRADQDGRRKSAALFQEIEEHHRLYETSVDLIAVTDDQRRISRVSHSCKAILGYEPEEMVGRCAGDFVRPSDLPTIRREMQIAAKGGTIDNFQTHFVHKDGRPVAIGLTGVWSEQAQRFFLIGRDMTERNAAEQKLKSLALFDQLTGLPNRASLVDDLAAFLAAKPSGGTSPTSIAMFDLDGFKDINDTLGHSVGDRLLVMVAERLSATLQAGSQVYRLGGDEFFLIKPNCGDPLAIGEAATAALRRLEQPFDIQGRRLFVGASAGIAIAPADGTNVDDLIANADLALYDAKAAGGRKCRQFVPTMLAKAKARQEIDGDLRRACAENEFVLHFQPQLRLSDGVVVGAEALLRWNHPERGLLMPRVFIDALAQSPAAIEVGAWILRTACHAALAWQSPHAPIRVGVNLFPVQVQSTALIESVQIALASGLPASCLEIEITENIALGQDDTFIASLRSLRAMGVGLALDDFGTGYASLNYLTHYPLTRIKIDQSFVKKIRDGAAIEDTAVVHSLVTMAHNLRLQVIAEGVENSFQENFLRSKSCEEAQGFFYAPAMPAADFQVFLETSRIVPDKGPGSIGAHDPEPLQTLRKRS